MASSLSYKGDIIKAHSHWLYLYQFPQTYQFYDCMKYFIQKICTNIHLKKLVGCIYCSHEKQT